MDEVREAYRISGRVQGVGFRAWAARRARELGLRGWVRNRPDGVVDVCVAGEPESVAAYSELLRRGPPLAHVALMMPIDCADEALSRDFEIRY